TPVGGAGALSLLLSCCAVERLTPVSSTTPTQTSTWRITTSRLPGSSDSICWLEDYQKPAYPAGHLCGFYTCGLQKGPKDFLVKQVDNSRFCDLHSLSRRTSIHVAPIRPCTNFHHQRHFQLVHAFHFLLDQFLEGTFFLCRHFEQQFVVYLQNHLRLHFFFL